MSKIKTNVMTLMLKMIVTNIESNNIRFNFIRCKGEACIKFMKGCDKMG